MLGRSRALDYIKHRKVLSFVELSEAEGIEDEKTLEGIVLADEPSEQYIVRLRNCRRISVLLYI